MFLLHREKWRTPMDLTRVHRLQSLHGGCCGEEKGQRRVAKHRRWQGLREADEGAGVVLGVCRGVGVQVKDRGLACTHG